MDNDGARRGGFLSTLPASQKALEGALAKCLRERPPVAQTPPPR